MKKHSIYREAVAVTRPCLVSEKSYHRYMSLVLDRLQKDNRLTISSYGGVIMALVFYLENGVESNDPELGEANEWLREIVADIDNAIERSRKARAAASRRRAARESAGYKPGEHLNETPEKTTVPAATAPAATAPAATVPGPDETVEGAVANPPARADTSASFLHCFSWR